MNHESFSSTLQMTLQPKSYRGTPLTPCLMPFWANTISHCAGLLLSLLTVLCGPTIHEACSAGANGMAAQYWNTALGFPGHATWRLAFTPQQGSPRRSLGHVDDFIHNLDLLVVQTDAIHCICTQWNATLYSWNHYLASIHTNFSRQLNLINSCHITCLMLASQQVNLGLMPWFPPLQQQRLTLTHSDGQYVQLALQPSYG